jgi:hypothetical protein
MKRSEMEIQIILVIKSILTSIITFCCSLPGKVVMLMGFFGALGLGAISPLIHIIIGFVFVDLLMGLAVSIKLKGWNSILSSKLRNSLIKMFFYLLIIIGLFVIETQLVDGYALTAKLAFGLIAGTELWSIMANMLILLPDLPALNLLKKFLQKEISKKTEIDEKDVEEMLKKGEENE